MTTLPSYADAARLADACPPVLLVVADREPNPKIRGWLQDLARCASAGRRRALAELVVEEAARDRQP